MSGGKTVCTSHYINYKVLTELLLLDIRYKATLAQNNPAALKERIMAQKNAASLEQTKTLHVTLTALDKRLAELDKPVVAAYEEKVKGMMPETLCIQLLNRYEADTGRSWNSGRSLQRSWRPTGRTSRPLMTGFP